MPKIYLVRHGESEFQKKKIWGGDSGLTRRGIEQARRVAEYLKNIELERIYCSKLKRSMQTAELIKQFHPNIPITQLEELNEIEMGLIDSQYRVEVEVNFPEFLAERERNKWSTRFPQGESYETETEKVRQKLREIVLNPGNTCIAGHKGKNRITMGILLNLPETHIPYIDHPNDTIFEIDLDTRELYRIENNERIKGYELF